MRKICDIESPYQRIVVGETGGVRFMRFGGQRAGWQGAWLPDRPQRLYFPYQQAFSLFPVWRQSVSRFLSIGVGTGTAIAHVHRRYPGSSIVGIDIDGAVIETAARYFAAPVDERVQWVEADARHYVPRMSDAFDLVFLDAFFRDEMPQTFVSPLFFQCVADLLTPGGLFVINAIVATAGARKRKFLSICRDLRCTVGPVWAVNAGLWPFAENNVVIFARRAPAAVTSARELRARAWKQVRGAGDEYGLDACLLASRIRLVQGS